MLYYYLAGKAGSPGPVGQARVEGGGENEHQDAELRRTHCTHTQNKCRLQKSLDRKVINIKVNEFCCTVGKSSKPYNFLPVIFLPTFSTDSQSASNSGFFVFYMELLRHFFANFEAKRARNGSKNCKTAFVNISWASFAKNVKIVVISIWIYPFFLGT